MAGVHFELGGTGNVMSAMKRFMVGLALATALTGSSVQAATIDWTDWSTNVSGTISGGIAVTYAGETHPLITNADFYNPGVSNYAPYTCCTALWYPTSTFTDGATVANAPPTAYNALRLIGSGITNTITFSQTVLNPVIAIWSLGNNSTPASFIFEQAVSIVATGPTAINVFYGNTGGLLSLSNGDKTVSGVEGNGTIQLAGNILSISFTSGTEDFYGFTVGTAGPAGLPATPLPAAWVMMLSGVAGLGFFAKRGARKSSAVA